MSYIQKNKRYSLVAILLFGCVLMQFLLSITTSYMDSGFYNRISVLIAVVAVGLYVLMTRKISISLRMFAIILVVILLLIYNYSISVLATQKLLLWVGAFLTGYIYSKKDFDYSHTRIIQGLMFIMMVTCIYGIFEFVAGNVLDAYAVRVYANIYRIHSVYLHPIIFSEIMLILYAFNATTSKKGIKKSIISIMAILCIALTLSRFSWIILLGLVFLQFIKNKVLSGHLNIKHTFTRKRVIKILAIGSLLIVMFIKLDIISLFARLTERWNSLEGSMSISYRTSTILALLSQRLHDSNIFHWIIGTGFQSAQAAVGNAGIYFGTVGNNVVDNQILCVFYDFGLVGIISICFFLVSAVKTYLFSNNNGAQAISLAIVVAIGMGFTCDTFQWATTGSLTFILMGIMLVVLKNEKRYKRIEK